MFPVVMEAVGEIMEPSQLRWISYSHFEADECGSLSQWMLVAPQAQAVATIAGVRVNLDDFTPKRPLGLASDSLLQTGKYRFRLYPTPHLPHGWDAGMLFEEITRTLFCSDLFHQSGNVEPITYDETLERARQVLVETQKGPMRDYIPYTATTDRYLNDLAALQPKILATQHGSTFIGDGARALRELGKIIKEVYE